MYMLSDYRNFFNSLELLLFVVGPEGKIIYCNDTACIRLGYSRDELLGMPVINIHPPDQRLFAGIIINQMLEGTAEFCPIPIQTKEGELIQVETRVSMGQWDGEEVLFGVTKDVTDLKLSNDKFITIFRFNPVAIAITGVEDGKIYEVNDAWVQLTGYTTEEAIGNTVYGLQLYRSNAEREALISELETMGFLNNYHITMKMKDGKIVVGQFSASPIIINGIDCWITAMIDVTDQAKLEAAIIAFKETVQHRL